MIEKLRFWLAVLASGFASFLLVPLMVLLNRPYFVYENGTDEATYLSYQGALAMQGQFVRWTSGWVTLKLHEIGISGAWQNLLMDVTTLAALAGAIYFVVTRVMGQSGVHGLIAGWTICFSSVLANHANPLLRNVFPNARYVETLWIAPTEAHLPLLRSPEPQLSILISLVFVALFLRTRNALVLLLALPFLYVTYLVGYAYLAGTQVLMQLLSLVIRNRPLLVASLANLVVIIVGVLAFKVAGMVVVTPETERVLLASFVNAPRLSPNLLFTAAAVAASLLILRRFIAPEQRFPWLATGLALVGAQLFLANQQVFSGIEIYPTGLQNVSASMLSGASLAMLLWSVLTIEVHRLRQVLLWAVGGSTALLTALSIHVSQGLDLVNHRYLMLVNHHLDERSYRRIVADPLTAVVPGEILSQSIAMAAPRMLAPPFSSNYAFPWYASVCPEVPQALADAAEFTRRQVGSPDMERWWPTLKFHMDRALAASRELEPRAGAPCGRATPLEFELIPLDGDIERWLLTW